MSNRSTACCTVVVPLFNKEATIDRALASVQNQTVQDFEVVVVDDGSLDSGPSAVTARKDQRLRMIRQSHAGVAVARNRGIREARTEWIAFLDADDEWRPDHLHTLLRLRDAFPQCPVLASRYEFAWPDGRRLDAVVSGPHSPEEHVFQDYFGVASRSHPPICSSNVGVSRSAILSVGGFPPDIWPGEDLLTWARLAVRYPIAYSMRVTAVYWRPQSLADVPLRPPDPGNAVGRALNSLRSGCPPESLPGLILYLARWQKMRASAYLRTGQTLRTLSEIRLALRANPLSVSLYAYPLLLLLPIKWRIRLFQARDRASRRVQP